jgi:hypothetical protein
MKKQWRKPSLTGNSEARSQNLAIDDPFDSTQDMFSIDDFFILRGSSW